MIGLQIMPTHGQVAPTGFTYDPNARINSPRDVMMHSNGDIFFTELNGVKKMTPTGSVSKINAGVGYQGIIELPNGNLAVTSTAGGHRIDEMDVNGTVIATRYGDGTNANLSGIGTAAQIRTPKQMAIVGNTLYVQVLLAMHEIDITTWSGTAFTHAFGFNGFGVTVLGGNVYGSVYNQHTIRRSTTGSGGPWAHWAGTTGASGVPPGNLEFPVGLTTDGVSNIWGVSRNLVYHVDPATAVLTFLAGDAASGALDGVGAAARFRGVSQDWGIDHDAANNRLLVADSVAESIRAVDLTTNEVTTIIGALDTPGDVDS